MHRAALLLLGILSLSPAARAQTTQPAEPPGLIGACRDAAAISGLAGSWAAEVGDARVLLRLGADRRFDLDGRTGTFDVRGDHLILTPDAAPDAPGAGGPLDYTFAIQQGVLTLSGGDLAAGVSLEFTPVRRLGDYRGFLAAASWQWLKAKGGRILYILAVVIVCRLVLYLVSLLSHLLIFSDAGPLRYLYRSNRNRARTLHSLVLNIAKYVVYFTALGFVLNEVGVNYTAYLASLSVIGLAIGFGSQGLVQDVVTGFFLIFEGQFDVGDMVEIGGQVGRVEDLGLRMTRLRNYVGEAIMIPNRNIGQVGNFSRGALHARIDVAVPAPDQADDATALLVKVGREIARQFEGVIIGPPLPGPAVLLGTGECFARLRVELWPGQQWVIDQQFLPRIREAFAREGRPVPGDRIAAFYHERPQVQSVGWRDALGKLRFSRRKGPRE
ncbi:MAG: hypothetical protein BIFFINMI_02614 [Phycisphaerae bacterium]|nr:hypothetical protein [Phycisphaerae bacterium]